MDPRTVLVTGASGFVGRHLLPALSSAFPTALLIPTSRRTGVAVGDREAVILDLDRPESVRSVLEELRPDILVNLSGEAAPTRAAASPLAAWRSNFWQSLELAETVRSVLPDTAFIQISSADAYGLTFRSGNAVDEEQKLAPASPYGATKAAADLAIGEMALRGLRAIRLRPFNHTGPGQSADFVIPALARQITRIAAGLQEPVIRTGTLDAARDFLDVRDVCALYVEVVRRAFEISPGTIFNIASGKARPIADVLRKLLEMAGVDASIEVEASRVRANDIASVRGDASKARAYFDWRPKIGFDRTLADTLEWWRGQITGSD